MKIILFFLSFCFFVYSSPFWELKDQLNNHGNGISLRKSNIGNKELGVFADKDHPSLTPLLHIKYYEWIDPYGINNNINIPKDSILEYVYNQLHIESSSGTKPFLKILSTIPSTSPSFLSVLLLRLMSLSSSSSNSLYPWIQLLPKDLNGSLMWNKDELTLLQNSPLYDKTMKTKETIQQAYNLLDSHIFSKHRDIFPSYQYSFNKFLYAYQVVLSRSFIIGNDNTRRRVIIPLMDMINHLPLPDANYDKSKEYSFCNSIIHFDDKTNDLFVVTKTDIKMDDEIFINYGDYSNTDLLHHYGFFLDDNIDDYYLLQPEYKSPFPISVIIIDPYLQNGITNPPDILLNKHNMVGTLKLLWWQRLVHLNMKELSNATKVYYDNEVVSLDNELKAIRGSISILSEILDKYPTSIEYDIEFLNSHPELSTRVKLAIKQRLNEKQIIRTSIGHLRAFWHYILKEGNIPSSRELLQIPEDVRIILDTIDPPPGEKLKLPREARYTGDKWELLKEMYTPLHKEISELNNQKILYNSSIIEYPTYKPIINYNDNELKPLSKNNNNTKHGRIKIAILVASKVNKRVSSAFDLPVVKYLLQTMLSMLSSYDLKHYFLNFYIGFDSGDIFYDSETNMKILHEPFRTLSNKYPIHFRTICTGNTHGAPARSWSRLGNLAYHEGNEYFFQVNDDISIESKGWLHKLVNALQKQDNIGVVGPIDPLRNLLTQAFVHRSHFEIFDPMYPYVFKNWYMDDWMELVYGKYATVVDDCIARNSPHPPRYDIDNDAYKYLIDKLEEGCLYIQGFLKANKYTDWNEFECTQINPKIHRKDTSVSLNPSQYKLSDPIPKPETSKFADLLESIADDNNVIMITFTNTGFLQMTMNWIINIAVWDIPNYLVIALDENAYNELINRNIKVYYDYRFSTSSDRVDYLEGHYRELVNLKTAYNLRILSQGYHTLLCDNDIALLQNPLEHVKLDDMYDIQIQDDSTQLESQSAVNTGFQLVKSNRKTVLFYKRVYTLTQSNVELQDQRAYNIILQTTIFKHILSVKILDPLLYPNGWIFFVEQLPQKQQITPIIIHNNWIKGLHSKIHRFRENNLWLIDHPNYYLHPDRKYITYTNVDPKVTSYTLQSEELYQAILIAKHINRTLILPPFKTFNGEKRLYTAETLYNMEKLYNIIPLREHSFIANSIHKDQSYSPLYNAVIIDFLKNNEKPCYEQRTCFNKGHKGFITFKSGMSIDTSKGSYAVSEIQKILGYDSKVADTPLIVLPKIMGIFSNLEQKFAQRDIDLLNEAVIIRSAPHK